MDNLNILVAVCTHNRKKYLLEAVKSFKVIKQPKFKLAVIDSSDEGLSKKEQGGIDIYIYCRGKKALSIKRNLAIKKIKSDIVVFTDDDCIATASWLAELTRFFADKGIACVTGRTIPFKGYEGSEYEKKFSFDKLGKRGRIIKKHLGLQNLWRFGHGNNMAFRTNILEAVGLFDINLGVGSRGLRAEDVDMFYRVYKKGYSIIYNPNAVILHKHLVKREGMEKAAYENGYASKLVLFKNLDLNTRILYFGGIIKLSLKLLLSKGFERRVNLSVLRGWLGLK